jgi:transforming growth factor-beta-induced protein
MSFRTKFILIFCLMLWAVMPTFAQDETASPGLIDAMKENPKLSKFVELLEFVGIDQRFNDTDLFYTVFAFENDQVEQLLADMGADKLEDISDANQLALSIVLTYHFMPGAYDNRTFDAIESVSDGPLVLASALSGTTLTYEKGEINGVSKITDGDILGNNGYIHIIDKYLIPTQDTFGLALDVLGNEIKVLKNQDKEDSIADYLKDNDDFSMIRDAFEATDLLDDLDKKGPYTIFIMNNDSLEGALKNADLDWDDLLNDPESLTKILTLHILPGQYSSTALKGWDKAFVGTMLAYTVSQITVDDDTLYLSGVEVTDSDIVANNGIIHVIDGIVLPPPTK